MSKTTTTTSSHWVHRSTLLFRVNLTGACMRANVDVAHARGAAWRRRQRWLRAHWRHEQRTLQMLLATYEHHAAPRGQRKARSGEEVRVARHGHDPEQPPPQPELFQLFEEEPGAVHRTRISCAPWSRLSISLLRYRFWMHLWRRWWNSCRTSRSSSTHSGLIPSRLSECPRSCLTIVSYSLLQRTLEQHVDIPVPGGGGRHAGLQGFDPEQNSTATLSSAERISERIVEQIVDIPVSGGVLQDFRPGQSSPSDARSPTDWLNTEDDEAFQVGFRTFSPPNKSAKVTELSSARVPWHVSSSTSSAYGLRSWVDDDTGETWTLLTDPALGSWWDSLRMRRSQRHPPRER